MAKKNSKKILLPDSNVNITALLDVLTVLLFFLIKSMSVNSLYLEPPEGIRLPASSIKSEAEESVRVALSNEALSVDGKTIVKLKSAKFMPKDLGKDGRTIIPLKKLLEKQIKKKHSFYKDVGDIENLTTDKVIVQADKNLPFGLIKYLLHTVVVAGYTDYQFVVIPKDK